LKGNIKIDHDKILIIRLSSIGDILLATPLLRVLRKKFPVAEIDFIIKQQYSDLLKTNPYINNLITFDASDGWKELKSIKKQLKERKYNLIVDIHKNFRSFYLKTSLPGKKISYKKYVFKRLMLAKLGWNLYREVIPVSQRYIDCLSLFGIENDLMGPEFFLENTAQKNIDILLINNGLSKDQPTICLAPGAGLATKRWPVENFINIAQKFLNELNAQIILLGDKQDQSLTQKIADQLSGRVLDLAGKLNIMETACAMNHADLVITNDTGLMHLASALNKKIIAIFGPTTRELGFFPLNPFARVIENNNLKCRPCTKKKKKKCPKDHFKCMKEINPELVFNISKKLYQMK